MRTDLLRIGGRVAAGFGAAGAAVVLTVGAALLPDAASRASGTVIDPVPVQQERACAGPLLASPEGATGLGSFGVPDVTSGTLVAPGAPLAGIASPDVPIAQDNTGPFAVTAPAAAAANELLAAAQTQWSTGNVAGLAAAACAEGAAESWILAGATDTGRTSLLMLANPSGVPATVDLGIYTSDGELQAPGLTGIVVPAFAQRTLSLAGYAPGQAQLAVQVRSRGGLVAATLQQTVVRGLEAGGADLVGPTAPAATTQTIPGIRITTAEAAAARAGTAGSPDVGTVLRLLAPANGDEVGVTLALTPEAGVGVGSALEVRVDSGVVVDVPIENLPDGVYTATLTASAPILASARASTVAPPLDDGTAQDGSSRSGGTAGRNGVGAVGPAAGDVTSVAGERIDLAWFVAAGPLTTSTAFTTVGAPAPRLAIVNPGGETASITIDSSFGPYTTEIAPGSSIGLDLAPRTIHVLTSTVPVQASVSYAGDGALASYPVRPANALATPLTVYR